MIPGERRSHALQFTGGLALCFAISVVWGNIAVLLYGHRGDNPTLAVLLACTAVLQVVAVTLLWRKFRFVALGILTFIGGEAVFVVAGWLSLLWLR